MFNPERSEGNPVSNVQNIRIIHKNLMFWQKLKNYTFYILKGLKKGPFLEKKKLNFFL